MSNSSLVVCTNISPNKDVNRSHKIDTITPHCVVGQVTAERLGEIFANPNKYASSNYGVDKNGRIGLYVEEKDCSWCSSNRDNDNRAITIEVASDVTHPYTITDAAYEGLIKLMVDICQRHGKKKLLWFGDKEKTLTYSPKADEMKMTVHRWFAQKSCPGDYIYARLPAIANEVTRRLNGGSVSVTVDTNNYPMIQKGSKNREYVLRLQNRLLELGYNLGPDGADGDFGNATKREVIKFQRAKYLETDGVVGPATWAALFADVQKAEDTKPVTEQPKENYASYPMIRKGSKGEYVKKLQTRLIELNYLAAGEADGDFGNKTFNALAEFQKKNGIEVDGVTGPQTWGKLYDANAVKGNGYQETPSHTPSVTYANSNAAVKKLIEIARAEIGYLEKASNYNLNDKTANAGSNNWNKYARDIDTKWPNFYNGKKNGYWWCDCFADWCFLQAFGYEMALKLLCAPEHSAGAGCVYSANYFRAKGQFHRSNPQPGDQVLFGTYGSEGHIGIVVDVDDRYVYTVEGNTSDNGGVVANGGGVFNKKYPLNSAYISGYGRPDWSLVVDTSKPVKEPVKKEEPKPTPVVTPVERDVNYVVRVTSNIPKYNAANGVVNGQVPRGAYTIIKENDGYGYLKSRVGWINLSHTTKI